MYLFDFELIIDMMDEELGLFILFNIIFKLVVISKRYVVRNSLISKYFVGMDKSEQTL